MRNLRTCTILCLMVFALWGCGSEKGLTHDQRKAQRKLKKAIKADPDIITKQYTDTNISGIVNAPVAITAPGFEGTTDGFNCDSLKRAVKALKEKGDDSGLYLHQDSLIDIKVKEDTNGQLSVAYNVKPRVIHDTIPVPYNVDVRVPGKAVNIYIKDKAWHHTWFWVVAVYALLVTGLYLSGRRQLSIHLKEADKK